ncbi:MAG: BatA and WFA domain-containing protein [Candidatus Poribacteria bacterium]|nr:BatA and WFA domain-containing protein [Candidatus Poribacteria bacterium]MDE0504196.1 BatA and WFA domain-containing protein [Candidatus Poribacteria bacterium]
MNFLSPTSLLLFGLAAPIVLLYILKLRRRREPVSTLMFWEQLFKEKQTTSLFQKLKHLLSLLLQLLFLTLLVLAIARPQFAFITKSARHIILIIDHSASMNAQESSDEERESNRAASNSRLESAKQRALRMVEGLRFMDEMMVISCHAKPTIHSPFTNHRKSLRGAIQSIQPTDIRTNLEPALGLAHAVARTKPSAEIVIFSDFQTVSEEMLTQLHDSGDEITLHPIQVGAVSDNVGITQFRVRKSLVNAFDYQTLLTVVNASEEKKKCNVELYFNEGLFDVRPYTLAPGESKSEIFGNFTFEGGQLKAVLDVADALHTDNVAYAALPKREHIPVLLVTEENPFLEKALSVDENLSLSVTRPEDYDANATGYNVVIFDRFAPQTLGDGNYMIVYPPKKSPAVASWEIGDPLDTPIVTDWERTHPILRHVHLENVQIGEAYHVKPPATAAVLARSFEDPVLFVDVTPKRKIVFAAIDILQSDLPLRIAFPVIIANTIQWFQDSSGIEEYHLHTGEVLTWKSDGDGTDAPATATITGPGDQTWETALERGEVLFDRTEIAGFYTLKIGDSEKMWAVNLSDDSESHIGVDASVEDLLTPEVTLVGSSLLQYPPWVYLVFLAAVLSVVEWFLYQRRRID